MTSTASSGTHPLDATDKNANVDEIDTEIATSIADSSAKVESQGTEDSISTSDLVPRDETESKLLTTMKTTPTDTAKSLNESNNKIIKELDDETAKTFPQIVSQEKFNSA